MPAIEFFPTLRGSPAEELWAEGMWELIRAGRVAAMVPADRVTPAPLGISAWLLRIDGEPAALHAARILRGQNAVDGAMTYARPQHRGRRLYAEIQKAMDKQMLAEGVKYATFTMPDTDTSDRLARLVVARGGEQIDERQEMWRCGPIRVRVFRRPLIAE